MWTEVPNKHPELRKVEVSLEQNGNYWIKIIDTLNERKVGVMFKPDQMANLIQTILELEQP